ncbi:iron ABC transporter permease [Arenicella sp. 4NH20-0111]|uniref:ABC transporter permease n=1 Tax=Arenicella sp. 4NH20-0111 TaxID=3127648 RepID=UPI0031081DDD
MIIRELSWQLSSLAIASLVFFPLVTLLWVSVDANLEVLTHLAATVLQDYVTTSILLMVGVAILTLCVGVGSAWLVTHFRFTGDSIFSWALLLPLAVPTYITAYSYTGLLDVAGPIQSYIRQFFEIGVGDYWFPEIRSLNGAIFVIGFVLYPYVYLLARSAFMDQSGSLQDVSRLLGFSSKRTFFKITLPIARPAIVAGVSLALMETLADFGAVSYFGLSTFTTGIFRTWYGLDSVSGAAQLALMLLSFIIVLMVIEKHSRKRSGYQSKMRKQPRHTTKLVGASNAIAFTLALTPVLLGFILPMLQLIVWSVQTHAALYTAAFWSLVANTLGLASVTTTIALFLALIIAYANRLAPNRVTSFSKRVAGLGYAVPGTIIAVGTLIPLARLDNTIDAWFRMHFDLSTGLLLSGTLAALIIAYLVRFLAVALSSIDSGLNSISLNIDYAARSLGQAPLKSIQKVHIPMLKGSLITALLIVFVDVMKELPATLILRPFNFNTLAVRAYELASDERLMDASLASLFIVLAGLVPVILLTKASVKR